MQYLQALQNLVQDYLLLSINELKNPTHIESNK